jgi:NAD-dependent dihydropyrimidine dehydrogenase PreA subunit
VIKTSRIADRVDHRTLILPQLAAPGIDVARVEKETGWHCRFGPVYARDIPGYVAAGLRKGDEMRRVRFPLAQRLEMGVMWAWTLSLVAGIPVAIVDWRALPGVLALIWSFALALMAFYGPVMRLVPGPVALIKTALFGLAGVAGLVGWSLLVGHWAPGRLVGWSLGILAVALALGFDLEGTSPIHAGATVSYWAARWPAVLKLWSLIGYELEMPFALRVAPDLCRGCRTCVEVCPKGVFELYRLDGEQKSRVARSSECEQCTACVKQCPERAIVATPPIRAFGEV